MKIFKYLKPYWYLALLAPIAMVGEVLMDLFQPKLMSEIVNVGLGEGKNDIIIKYLDEFKFDEDKQFIFEGILYSALTLYNNGGASRSKLAESHKRFVQEIEQKNEEKLSRTQQLNTIKIQALKELGFTEINETNAAEVFEKIAEIQSRKV